MTNRACCEVNHALTNVLHDAVRPAFPYRQIVVFVIEPTRTVDAADPVRQFLDASRATVVALPATGPKALFNAQVAVAKAQLDVLVFADVAIHVIPYLLSFGRFAPVRVAC